MDGGLYVFFDTILITTKISHGKVHYTFQQSRSHDGLVNLLGDST